MQGATPISPLKFLGQLDPELSLDNGPEVVLVAGAIVDNLCRNHRVKDLAPEHDSLPSEEVEIECSVLQHLRLPARQHRLELSQPRLHPVHLALAWVPPSI